MRMELHKSEWKAVRVRIVLRVARHALLPQLCGPWCEWQSVFEVLSDVRESRKRRIRRGIEVRNHRTAEPAARGLAALPCAGEIDFAIGKTRRRRIEIGLAIQSTGRVLPQEGGPLSVQARRDRGRTGAHQKETSHLLFLQHESLRASV